MINFLLVNRGIDFHMADSVTRKALPHHEVDTADFYKHIESEGSSEPRRMRQLLIWCATRAMGEKPSGLRSEDESARLAGRIYNPGDSERSEDYV